MKLESFEQMKACCCLFYILTALVTTLHQFMNTSICIVYHRCQASDTTTVSTVFLNFL